MIECEKCKARIKLDHPHMIAAGEYIHLDCEESREATKQDRQISIAVVIVFIALIVGLALA